MAQSVGAVFYTKEDESRLLCTRKRSARSPVTVQRDFPAREGMLPRFINPKLSADFRSFHRNEFFGRTCAQRASEERLENSRSWQSPMR